MKLFSFTKEHVIKPPLRRFLSPTALGVVLSGIFGFHVCADATNCVTRPAGLVSWWRSEGNGHDSAGTNHGTLINSISFEPGMVGQASRMVANPNPRIFVPDNPTLQLTNSISIEGWIRTGYGGGWVLNRGDDTAGEVPYGVAFYDAFRLHFIIASSANNWLRLPAPTPIPSNAWVHIAATLDGDSGDMRLYVNGQVVAQTNTTFRPICPLTGANRSVCIGNAAGTSAAFPFDGLIDEIALYSRALTQSEIQSIYAAGSAGKCTRPPYIYFHPRSQVGYWGKNVTFDVAASGEPPLSYQWLKNGAPISGATSSSLSLTNLQMPDTGDYAVVVTNTYGSVTSNPAIFIVTPADVSVSLHAAVTIEGVVGLTYGIQSSTNLDNANSWQGVVNIPLSAPTMTWFDVQPATKTQRYYRVVPGPISIP